MRSVTLLATFGKADVGAAWQRNLSALQNRAGAACADRGALVMPLQSLQSPHLNCGVGMSAMLRFTAETLVAAPFALFLWTGTTGPCWHQLLYIGSQVELQHANSRGTTMLVHVHASRSGACLSIHTHMQAVWPANQSVTAAACPELALRRCRPLTSRSLIHMSGDSTPRQCCVRCPGRLARNHVLHPPGRLSLDT